MELVQRLNLPPIPKRDLRREGKYVNIKFHHPRNIIQERYMYIAANTYMYLGGCTHTCHVSTQSQKYLPQRIFILWKGNNMSSLKSCILSFFFGLFKIWILCHNLSIFFSLFIPSLSFLCLKIFNFYDLYRIQYMQSILQKNRNFG